MTNFERFLPVLAVPAVPVDGKIRFLCENEQIELNERQSTEVSKILSLCNGQNDPMAIAEEVKIPVETVKEILKELEEERIVVDSRKQFTRFHALSSNLLETISRDSEFNACDRLHFFLVLDKEYGSAKPGYYEVPIESDELDIKLLSKDVDVQQLLYALNRTSLESTLRIIIIAGEFDENLTNRDYRSLLIEVGKYLNFSEDNDDDTCAEYTTDFLDEVLKKELRLKENVWPLAVVFENVKKSENSETQEKRKFVKKYAGAGLPVYRVSARTFEDGAFFGAMAMFTAENGYQQFSGATSTSYDDAVFKATAEGYERWQSGRERVDYFGPAKQLPGNWADPRILAPLTQEQSECARLKCFIESLPIAWTKGKNYDGTEIYVPSDLVYYGQKPTENPVYRANSSGVAGHFFFGDAKIRAVAELIERDAIMRCWFLRKPPNVISEEYLPIHAKKRIRFWKEKGFHVRIHQLDCVAGAVFLATITGDAPAFVSGASSTLFRAEIKDAILKALEEAEYNLLLGIENPQKTPLGAGQVMTPIWHGRFYHLTENAKKLDWLLQGKVQKGIIYNVFPNFTTLFEKLGLITVNLKSRDCPLEVVRVLSPKLVPISFGVSLAHYAHQSLEGELNPDATILPHFFS